MNVRLYVVFVLYIYIFVGYYSAQLQIEVDSTIPACDDTHCARTRSTKGKNIVYNWYIEMILF